ncbi:MAG: carbon-nitrogen hydrolase family protein [Lentisphaerae bacterium]|jgi:deaminated glutathione amidase|nr:carbon-nitrogen hydrolase family protein [Lentisphaerota bacterium]MBT5605882.1 carbon-nitrogen hydrolase family protein [Lentisphaerota bacterium]MBT7057961.1 carbon-nitrogen hydrolase family protein [Lentisphaerota bacterium]MBT7848516.1 carbon-nitrogen hydrolase family protein [Lentisphaerota bacterium]
MSPAEKLRIGVVQMASSPLCDENSARVGEWLGGLRGQCDLVVFPENVLCLGRGSTIRSAATTEDAFLRSLRPSVAASGMMAVFGGVPILDGDDGAVRNASIVLDATGDVVARYDKIHLFQLRDGAGSVDETAIYAPGETATTFTCQGWSIGLSICYDLRFPELYRRYAPCDMIVCTAAFTQATGEAHWEVLLRARAIENQCYVAAAGQCGINAETRNQQYGHSMVVDPWGEVVSECEGDEETATVVAVDRERLQAVRERLPALQNIRLREGEG